MYCFFLGWYHNSSMFTDNSFGIYDITQVMELFVFDSAYGSSSEAVRCSLSMWHRSVELKA